MLRTCGIEFARRAFFVVAPIANPTKTRPIQRRMEVPRRRTTPVALDVPDSTSRTRATTTPGSATNNPMYIASRIFDFNRSPHDLDERVLEARRFERHLALLPQAPLDDRQDLLARLGLEDLRSGGPIPRGRFHDHPHPDAGIAFRLVDRSEEGGPPFVDD